MAPISKQIAELVDILPAPDQRLAYELIKKLVLAWDPDFTKVTPAEEEQARAVYAEFTGAYREMKEYFRRQVRAAAQPVLEEAAAPVSRLIFQASAAANLSKLLTEQLILLRREEPPEAGQK